MGNPFENETKSWFREYWWALALAFCLVLVFVGEVIEGFSKAELEKQQENRIEMLEERIEVLEDQQRKDKKIAPWCLKYGARAWTESKSRLWQESKDAGE